MPQQPGDPDLTTGNPGELPTTSREGPVHESPLEGHATDMIGKKIGRYTIKRITGSGGMGTVFEALQEQPRRRVAIKMMKRGITSRSAQRRFEFESQLLGRLRHPGIAQVYEAGTYDDGHAGRPYFVMEYIANAKTLTEYAEDKKLSTRERLAMFSKVCDAVQHGHLKGIVHRDLKPGNILVGSAGQPRIIDFGVARSTDSDMAVTTLQTDVGQLVGTLQYMSPEQVEADPSDIDARSDVYALGIILYELLTGRLPYDVRDAAIHEAVRIVREDPPTRLSTIDRHLRGDVETITMKAMEKLRSDRYQSATELQQDIKHYLADEPISASPPGAIDFLRRFARRHRAAAMAIASVFIILLGAVIGIGIFAMEANSQRSAAQKSQARAESVSSFVSTMLSSIDPVTSGNLDKQVMTPVLAQASESLDRRFDNEPLVKADIHGIIGNAYQNLSLFQDAEPHLEESLRIRNELLGRDHLDTVDALAAIGQLRSGQRLTKEALPIREEVATSRRRLLGDDHSDTQTAILQLAASYSVNGNFEEADLLYNEVLDYRREALGETHRDTIDAEFGLGSLMVNRGDYEAAERQHRKTLDLYRNTLGSMHPRTLLAMKSNATILAILKRDEEAKPLLIEAIDGQSKVLGEDHYTTLRSINDLADLLLRAGNLAGAEPLYREALAGRRRVLGNDHGDTLWSLFFLGDMLRKAKRFDEAEPYLRECMESRRRVLGEAHLRTLESVSAVASLLKIMGKYAESERYYRDCLAGRLQLNSEDHRMILAIKLEITDLLRRQKRFDEAKVMLSQVLERSIQELGEDAYNTKSARKLLILLEEDMSQQASTTRLDSNLTSLKSVTP